MVILSLTAVLVLSGCAGDEPRPAAPAPSTVGGGETPGPELTVSGRVTRTVTAYVFEVGREEAGPLLVVSPRRNSAPAGAVVQVTGRVRTLRVVPLAAELRIDLDDPRLRRFEGQTVLVAAAVEVPPR